MRDMLRSCCVLINVVLFLLSPVSSLTADIFRWVDEEGVVHFTDNLHNIPEKKRSGVTRIKARETPKGQESSGPAPLDKASVPFEKKGEVVIVKATVNGKASARFVVDTGASYTMISQATARELEIDTEKKLSTIPFQTANGVILAPLVKLDSIEVGGMRVNDLTAAIHDIFSDPSIAGLLGLDFLSNFRMDIDTQNALLTLEKK